MEQQMAKKFIPTALNQLEMALALDSLRQAEQAKKLVSAFFPQQYTIGKWHSLQYQTGCGVMRSNRLTTSKHLLLSIDDQLQHCFQTKCLSMVFKKKKKSNPKAFSVQSLLHMKK